MRTTSAFRFGRALCISAALAACSLCADAQDGPTEQAVRAALVFNFLKFTEFPADAGAGRLRLCVAVDDARQAEALAALSGRKVAGRELAVARLNGQDEDCQVLYVDARARWAALAESRAARQALTFAAYPGFAQDGGMIEIAHGASGTRFDIDLGRARRAGLRLSPQLLRLARQVHE